MSRIVKEIRINGKELNALFDTGSLRSYLKHEFHPVGARRVPAIRVGLEGKTLDLDQRCDVTAAIEGLEFDLTAYLVEELGETEQGRIDAIIGALCMEERYMKLDPRNGTLDLSGLRRREFTEF